MAWFTTDWFSSHHTVRCAHKSDDVINFIIVECRSYSRLKWYKNYKNRLRLAKVIVKNKMSRFFMVQCVELLYRTIWTGMLLPTPSAPPGQIAANRRSHEDACARVRQQPAGLLQQFVVRRQRRLTEETADSSQCSRACCDRSRFRLLVSFPSANRNYLNQINMY